MKNLEDFIILDLTDLEFLKKIPFLLKNEQKNFSNVTLNLLESVGDLLGI